LDTTDLIMRPLIRLANEAFKYSKQNDARKKF